MMKGFQVTENERGCTFAVHVLPRSQRDAVVGLYGEALKVRLKAPPAEGQANQALRRFLAARLGLEETAVEIVAGHTSRHKVVRVTGVREEQVRQLVGDAETR